MTGFGEATSHSDGVHYAVEVRSLNNKYFKASIRLPDDLQTLEPEIESSLRQRLTRGSIVCTVRCSDSSEAAALVINHRALGRYIEQLEGATGLASGKTSIDVTQLLQLPGVLQPHEDTDDRLEKSRISLAPLVREACDHLVSMRQREGRMLMEDLMSHHAMISARLQEIGARAPQVVDDYQKRLRARLDKLLEEVGRRMEPSDLIREVAIFAERSDIAEEVTRLSAHLDQFQSLITDENDARPIGRTLDFLAQEMLREANTIASKSSDASISRAIVEVKGSIDRIKEQVQNIE